MTAETHVVHRVGRGHCLAPSRTVDAPAAGARYGRMFPHLPSLAADVPALEAAGFARDASGGRPYHEAKSGPKLPDG